MASQFTLREMQPADGPALKQLMENDPESPGMSITTQFLVDPYRAWAALKPNLVGVVAEAPGVEGLIGAATVSFDVLQYNGQTLPTAYLENLKVHHAHRGKGLGTALVQWRIDQARQHFGSDGVIITGTLSDNTASLSTMKKWATQFIGPLLTVPRPSLNRAPSALPGVTIRPVEKSNLEAFAEKHNRFYADYGLYPTLSAEILESLLVGTEKFYHGRVAVASNGDLLAGMVIAIRSSLMIDQVKNAPLPLRLMNAFLHMLPADGTLRFAEIGYIWFEHLPAAQYLWDMLRWEFRGQANSFSAPFDPRSSLGEIFQIKPWHMPKLEITLALNAPTPFPTEKRFSNVLRG